MSAIEDFAAYDTLSALGALPSVKPALNPDGSRKTNERGEELWAYSTKSGVINMTENAASEALAGAMMRLNGEQQAQLANLVMARTMINKLSESEGFVTQMVGRRMDAGFFMSLADAARVKIDSGASPSLIDDSLAPGVSLGQLAGLSDSWKNRLETARHDREQQLGRALTAEEEDELNRGGYSLINRQFNEGRNTTLFRFVRGDISVAEVLEEVVEDSIERDMVKTGRDVSFYVGSVKQLEKELGKKFLQDKDAYTRQDVLEALGKIVEGKVLADTAKSNNGLSDWVNDFLTLIRKWVSEAVAMVRLGHEVNKVLSDSGARERLGDELVNLVEDLAHKNTEFMRGLQRDATLRYTTEAATMKPDPTPILTEAMEKHGEQVRKERETRERQHKELSADIAAACAAEEGFSASVVQVDEIKSLQAEENALEFQRKGEFEYADLRTENRAETQEAASGSGSQGAADGDADAQAGTEVQRGVPVRRSQVQSDDIRGVGGLLRAGRSLRHLAARVHRFHGEASSKASALGFYTGHLYELRQDDAEAAQAFADCINAAKASRGVKGDCVYTYEVEEYRQMRLFLTPDGKAGIALKPNGDMVSVFSHREQKNTLGGKAPHSLIALAINEGAVKADCYGFFLVRLYGKHGFRAIAKDAFNAEFATEAMQNRETMLANFKQEDGKPDVVYLTYMGNRETALDDFNDDYKPTYQDRLGYSDYDTCCATQDAGVKEARKIEALPAEVKQPVLDATNDIDLRHLGLVELTRVKSERNRRRAVDMVHAGAVLQESGVDVTTEAGAQKVADMAEYAARCREQLEARAQKPLDEDTQARVLATLMCWNRWTELGELVDAAAAWDGKKRVTPKLIEAPTEDAGFSASIRFEDSSTTGHSGLSSGHMAFAQVIADNASRMLAAEIERFRTFDDKVQGSREKALSGWIRRGAPPSRAGSAASVGGRERARAEPRTEASAPWWKGAPGRGRRQSRPPVHT